MDVARIQKAIETVFDSDDNVVAAYLFGSFARDDARADSDVDIAILERSPPSGTLASLRLDRQAQLEKALGRAVDLVVLNTAPVDLVHRVLRDRTMLLERDESARIAFEVDARRRYFDRLPIVTQYRKRMIS